MWQFLMAEEECGVVWLNTVERKQRNQHESVQEGDAQAGTAVKRSDSTKRREVGVGVGRASGSGLWRPVTLPCEHEHARPKV